MADDNKSTDDDELLTALNQLEATLAANDIQVPEGAMQQLLDEKKMDLPI
jgi:hypothetical protein